ncbi:polysaccharide biosynthesis protein [Sulfurovum sp. TSL6]|uniref:lipopolysaccharide biosynthesis protein n=1 Tax=Sulfurovum sp. TSL6 TaxID=2826995 RepID=UPI001CC78244|nr:oligosaccharide flippase family protein [Sulfurovum sp. TSL6]GIU01295.1 polysaccharide biosynthesis protein [Sulfurovum sp. TSL6]
MIKKLKPKSEFSRNVLTLMTGTTIAQAIPIAISPILTRIYTPEDFGVFALFMAITGLFSVVASGRYELALMIPKEDEDAINIFALGMTIVLFLALFLLTLVVLFNKSLTSILNNDEIGYWLYFVPIALFFTGLFNMLSYYNNRKKNYKNIANATIIKSIVSAIIQLSIGFVKAGVTGLISGHIVSTLFANTRLFKNIIKDKILLSKISKNKMITLTKHYKNFPKYQAPHAMLNTFSSNIPIYMFTPFFNLTVVGFYSLSTRIVFAPMMILAGASAKVYNQKVMQIHNEHGNSYGFTVRLLKSLLKKISIPFLIIIVFAPDIFAFVFGEVWREAGVYTQVLSPWLGMVIFTSTISFIPSLLNLQRKALFLEIVYTILRVIAISIGLYYQNVFIALICYSIVGFLMLNYNIWWMLSSLKKVN